MNKNDVVEIANDVENRSNKDLQLSLELLKDEFEKTKDLIIDLTRHMDGTQELYNKINNEIKKRMVN